MTPDFTAVITGWLAGADPSTQQVPAPWPDPIYLADPEEKNPDGSETELRVRNWPTYKTCCLIASQLGGNVTLDAPPVNGVVIGPLAGGFSLDQQVFYIAVDGIPTFAAKDLCNYFPGDKAVLKDALPKFLAGTN